MRRTPRTMSLTDGSYFALIHAMTVKFALRLQGRRFGQGDGAWHRDTGARMAKGATFLSWVRRFGSLRLRLVVLAAVLSLPPLAVIQWEQGRATRDRLADAAAGMAGLAGNAAAEKAALLGQVQTLLSAIAHLPDLRRDQAAACEAALRDIRRASPWLVSLGVFAPDGLPICTTSTGGQETSIGDQPYFRLAIGQRHFLLSDLLVGQVRWEPVVMAAEPVLDADGMVRLVIVAGIDLTRLGDLPRRQLPGGADLVLLADASGTVLAGRPETLDMVGRSLRNSRLDMALEGERRGDMRATWPDGRARVFGFAPVAGTDAILVVGRDEAAILAPLAARRRMVLLMSGGALLAGMLAALMAGQWLLVRPVARMGAAVRRIGHEDSSAADPSAVPPVVPVDPLGGEAAELAREVNAMTRRIDSTQRALRARNAELAALAEELARARDTAEAASVAKSRFVAAVSHELRTPLDGMLHNAQSLAADTALTWSQRQRLSVITTSSEQLLVVIRELLDLAAIEAGRASLAPVPLRLAGLVADCAALVRPMAEAKGLAFAVELVHPLPAWVCADVQRLRQVLLNLLGHAVKFTARGGVTLRTDAGRGARIMTRQPENETAASARAGQTVLVRFEIADTGAGMTAGERARLFVDSIRLPDAGRAESTGLGLAISARLVTLMGGDIQCDSTPGMGSCFSFELALPVAAAPIEAPPEAVTFAAMHAVPSGKAAREGIGMAGLDLAHAGSAPEQPSAQEGLRLLVADDVRANREVARSMLGAAGHSVAVVDNGAEAVTAALAEDWDAVLLDLHMPVLDGVAAARQIRQAFGPRGRVPIIAVTASATPAEVLECLEAGMNCHVEKPIRTRVLHDALARVRLETFAMETHLAG